MSEEHRDDSFGPLGRWRRDAGASGVLSTEDRVHLDMIAAELAQPDLTDERRSELLDAFSAIVAKYSRDPRLDE